MRVVCVGAQQVPLAERVRIQCQLHVWIIAVAKAQAEAMGARLELSNQGRAMVGEEVADEIDSLLWGIEE